MPASLSSDFIHMAGMTIHIALESTIHIAGMRTFRAFTYRGRTKRRRGRVHGFTVSQLHSFVASTEMLEKGTQAPSPSPDLILASTVKKGQVTGSFVR